MTIDDFIYENSIVRDNGSEYTADHIDLSLIHISEPTRH